MNIYLQMQPLNPHNLFSIFEQGDEEVYKENNMEDLLDNPFVLMGMVLRGIENYHTMDMMHLRNFGNNYKEVRFKIKNQFYNKLYGYLNRIDASKFETKYTVSNAFEVQEVFNSLNVLLIYFEIREEYEKCATIKKYQDLLKKDKELFV